MNVITTKQRFVLLALFALLMAATRFHHFGSALLLPDASLAVFFLAGFYLSGVMALAVLLLEAGLIDYLAITMGGVSDWCVTPAYWFLIPTYACLWYGGRWYAGRRRRVWSTLLPLIGTLLFSVSLAFLISNAGFYLFSGYFPQMGWAEYGAGVAPYYPRYAANAFLYVAFAALAHWTVAMLRPVNIPHTGRSSSMRTAASANDGSGR